MIPYSCAGAGFSSTLSLTTSTWPACSSAITSGTGPTWRHVLAHLDHTAQPALAQRELPELFADRTELVMGRPDDVVGRPGLGGPGQVTDLPEGKPEPPGPADQGQPPPVCHGVLTEARPPAFGQRQQSLPLIEPHSLDACSPGGEFPDRQPSHVPQASGRTPVRSQQDRTRHLTAGTPPSRLAARGPGGLNDPGSRGRRGLTVARTAGPAR